ncbi:heterokaryon incompatibility protein-domain-containing protein, partial [Pisolithus thermaeus]
MDWTSLLNNVYVKPTLGMEIPGCKEAVDWVVEPRKNYISPSETIAAIDPIVRGIVESCPHVVIDVTTDYLCDGPERIRIFKADPAFKELISSMTKSVDNERILRVISSFFGYVMFSYVWQGSEPSFQDVSLVKSVWNLPETPLNRKLQDFCKETRRLGHKWAWSDTCCIDKTTSSIHNRSITSMYQWYANSAATLVFLAGVAHPSKLGDLTRSLWMTRAWTLQELLAPKVVLFFDSEWKPYLDDTSVNHKESLGIIQELAGAMKIPRGTVAMFSPDHLELCEKLRLASTRNATVEEDIAYSLIGIFRSAISPYYGEGADAL